MLKITKKNYHNDFYNGNQYNDGNQQWKETTITKGETTVTDNVNNNNDYNDTRKETTKH